MWRRLRDAGLTYQKPERRYFEANEKFRLNRISRILFVVSLVVLIAVFYEFYEAFLRMLGLPTQPTLNDTIFDLFLGFAGGFSMGVFLEFFKS